MIKEGGLLKTNNKHELFIEGVYDDSKKTFINKSLFSYYTAHGHIPQYGYDSDICELSGKCILKGSSFSSNLRNIHLCTDHFDGF